MKIVLLGSGNVATHLGLALQKAGHEIIQVWSRNEVHAQELATLLGAASLTDILQIVTNADLYILAVKDDAISEIVAQLSLTDQLIVHTSGSTDVSVLEGVSEKFGVIYPVQTFSKTRPLDFKIIPVVVEGNQPEVTKELIDLAVQLSGQVAELNSEQRKVLHIAAVFACNFTNYMYTLSEAILSKEGLDFNLMRPMITETAAKVQESSPAAVQTGPGVRKDVETMKKHLDYLENNSELHDLYKKLSQGIVNFHYKP